MLAAFAMLGVMVLLFAGVPGMFQSGYELHILTDAAHDVRAGDSLNLAGKQVGRITSVDYTDNDPRKGVTIKAKVGKDIRIPSNIKVVIFENALGRGAYVELKPEGEITGDPFLPNDRATVLKGEATKSGLVPQELLDAAKGISKMGDSVSRLAASLEGFFAPPPTPPATATATGTAPSTATQTSTDQAAPPAPGPQGANLHLIFAKLDTALSSWNAVLGDLENQQNIKKTLANLAKATDSAVTAMDSLKQFAAEATKIAGETGKVVTAAGNLTTQAGADMHNLTTKLIEDAEKVSVLMTTLNNAAMKIDKGEGTMGKLINDPALYNTLVDMGKSIDQLSKNFDELIKQWRQRGIEMKLK